MTTDRSNESDRPGLTPARPLPSEQMAPGDQAPPGTPGTGESPCPRCGGSGRQDGGQPCPDCAGSGKVIVGIGGA
jgi:hypothetical protein